MSAVLNNAHAVITFGAPTSAAAGETEATTATPSSAAASRHLRPIVTRPPRDALRRWKHVLRPGATSSGGGPSPPPLLAANRHHVARARDVARRGLRRREHCA